MAPMPTWIPEEWKQASLHVFSELDRHDRDIHSLHGEVALARESLQGKAKQDVDAAHDKIREQARQIGTLKAELDLRKRKHYTINSALAASVVGLVEVVKYLVQHWH